MISGKDPPSSKRCLMVLSMVLSSIARNCISLAVSGSSPGGSLNVGGCAFPEGSKGISESSARSEKVSKTVSS